MIADGEESWVQQTGVISVALQWLLKANNLQSFGFR